MPAAAGMNRLPTHQEHPDQTSGLPPIRPRRRSSQRSSASGVSQASSNSQPCDDVLSDGVVAEIMDTLQEAANLFAWDCRLLLGVGYATRLSKQIKRR